MVMAQEQRSVATQSRFGLDLPRAFGFVFEDVDWPRKLAIGGLLALIPYVGTLFVYAYTLRAMRWVALDQPATLPQWRRRDLKRMAIEGLKLAVVYLLLFCSIALGGLFWLLLGGSLPDYQRGVPLLFQSDGSRLIVLLVMVVMVVAQARLAVTESICAASRPDQFVPTFLAAPAAWLVAATFTLLLGEARELLVWYLNPAGFGTYLVNTLLTAATTLYFGLVGAHLAGQACRQARRTWAVRALARYR
jgi:hypothetical protein